MSAGQLSKEERNEEVIFEKKASGKKKKTSKQTPQSSSKIPKEKSTDIQSTELHVETEEDIHSALLSTATIIPSGEVRINMEASDSTLPPSLSSTSATSEPPVCSPNETPQSTPVKSCSAESLSNPTNLPGSSESDMLACPKEPETAEVLTPPDEPGSTPTVPKSTLVTVTSETVVSLSTSPMDLLSSSNDSEERANAISLETGATNSSTESCKTPVAPSSDVMITLEHDDKLNSQLLVSENEASSAEVLYVRGESTTETIVDIGTNDDEGAQGGNDGMAMKDPIDEGKQFVTKSF